MTKPVAQPFSHFSLTRFLSQEGQNISTMTSIDLSQEGERKSNESNVQAVAHSVLISLMLHDCEVERVQTLKRNRASLGEWVLSEALALCFYPQAMTIETLHRNIVRLELKDAAISSLLATLEGLISQSAPLQTATQAIADLPDLSAVDQAIVLALYCWLCTPQHFRISVGRSHQAMNYLSTHNESLVSAMTGVLAGASGGLESIPTTLLTALPTEAFSKDIFSPLTPIADRLFQAWAGMSAAHPNLGQLQSAVVTHPGALKPRDGNHLELNSNYD